MAAPDYYVYDGDVDNGINPYRPGLGDVGGGAKVDDQQYPPDPDTDPTAADENQQERLLVGLCRVAPLATIHVTFSGSTPSIFALNPMGNLIEAADFTLTDNGQGDTTIQCDADKLGPPQYGKPFTQTTSDIRVTCAVVGTNDGIRVVTRNSAGAGTDTNFVLDWC